MDGWIRAVHPRLMVPQADIRSGGHLPWAAERVRGSEDQCEGCMHSRDGEDEFECEWMCAQQEYRWGI